MTFSVIIPARLASTRLPEKLLRDLCGKSVIERSYLAAKASNAKRVIIAADDQKIVDCAQSFGAEVVLTRKDHASGTDRLAECVTQCQFADNEIIVNLQGDEPLMPPSLINHCADALINQQRSKVSTLAVRATHVSEIQNPNAVKVVMDTNGYALYFSRAVIPLNRDEESLAIDKHYFIHLGMYGYRAGFLKSYQQLSPCALERIEKLEQLRVLYHGEKIVVAIADEKPPKGIDTEDDLKHAEQHLLQIKR